LLNYVGHTLGGSNADINMLRLIGRLIHIGFTLTVIIFAVVLALSNAELVAINIWPFVLPFNIPIWLLAVACFGTGLVAGGLAMLMPIARDQITIIKLKKSIQTLEKEKSTLTKNDTTLPDKIK
jgi:uncharacterized membrane protein YciS (DUF1049 family)